MTRVFLSPPDIGEREADYLLRALASHWVAPAGPELDAFEAEVAAAAGRAHGVALSSGTGGLHLALLVTGVVPGDDVLVPTLTFVAAANVVTYIGARPCFLDSDEASWNLDPTLLEDELERRARAGTLPGAVMAVDLYGQCADYARLTPVCARYGVPLVEDAAEALGAAHDGGPAGSFGAAGVFSFNGNKIITTSGGGMLVTDDEKLADRARHLATQAREPVVHYEHEEIGFNYRLSNVLAALGRAQLCSLSERIARRAAIEERYREELASLEGVRFAPRAPWGTPNHWLTCLTIDRGVGAATRDSVIGALAAEDIEARPVWKPMHRQPLYSAAPALVTGVADRVFEMGLCLPSGSSLTPSEQDRVIEAMTPVLAQ